MENYVAQRSKFAKNMPKSEKVPMPWNGYGLEEILNKFPGFPDKETLKMHHFGRGVRHFCACACLEHFLFQCGRPLVIPARAGIQKAARRDENQDASILVFCVARKSKFDDCSGM
jgi:hypothetical protein